MLYAPNFPVLPSPTTAKHFEPFDPHIDVNSDSAVVALSPGEALQRKEVIIQEHIFALTEGGRVGEAEKAAVGQL